MDKKTKQHIPINEEDISAWKYKLESNLIDITETESLNFTMHEHAHLYYEILFISSAIPITHTVNETSYETTSPCIIFRAPYVLHSTNPAPDFLYKRFQIAFHPCILMEYGGICSLGSLKNRWECTIPVTSEQLELIQPLLSRMWRVRDRSVPKNVWVGTLAALLYEISLLADTEGISQKLIPVPYMQELMGYIVENISSDLTLDTLAAKFFVSRAKLVRDFRTAAKMSIHRYISALRVERAKVLLADDLPLAIIAEKCGFGSESSFICMFKTRCGVTPGEYRKRLKY